MYNNFYGLDFSPFNITANPENFFESESHKKALANLIYGIDSKKGIILLTGEVGTGKTTLCKYLLENISQNTKTSVILNPCYKETELFRAILQDFGVQGEWKSKLQIVNALNGFLLQNNLSGGNAVLIIDEAQNMSVRQLEQIRLLSNLETKDKKLLQIVLSGQPELLEKINMSKLRQIKQRIFVKYNLTPLTKQEVKEYVFFKIKSCKNKEVFVDEASFDLIYNFSNGIPRLINMLCDRALLAGFVSENTKLNKQIFSECIKELM
ncbi:MAG: AAA family ATPase [Candidatus Omnitrophica bacterium]|nr:AAA family ATPase [Candidatus Omnitrophota bacterium]MDD5080844.1 AAA family ATPase [Candidatus Omnitrophota bacterium]